ncbi:FtsW/RodA/SpoVE family cell cycle protein [Hespellia stercorisuis]|uniref:Cell division protein FtsW, lipid II flippase n=1 Tax=Hespellia stercorisuis DSM 15480 TaxID=1121950 RepID=A0A1M6N0V0_9FIRM|nr:FtsW/RodA/SpoVE family cell cycle protein [Hespellia stercorisuis]SHJ89367.1 cell division protein FtsW, lipid II flippase [Hespellia stercorisuis DSM 15480]
MNEQEYLEILQEQIRCKKARELVASEVKDHIEDQAVAFEESGMSRTAAIEAAVCEMGDPVDTGIALDRVHRPQMEWRFLLLAVGIGLIGMCMQLFWGARITAPLYTGFGILIMLGVYFFDYSIVGKHAAFFTFGFLILCGLALFFFGGEIRGSLMYFSIGNIRISMWNVLHLYPPIYGAYLYSLRHHNGRNLWKALLLIAIPTAFAAWLPCLSLAFSLFMILMLMLSVALLKGWFLGNRIRKLAILWNCAVGLPGIFLGGIYLSGRLAPYQTERIQRYFTSGVFAGNGTIPRLSEVYNQENSTQYVIAYVTQYYGMLAGILLVAAMAFLIYKIFRISTKQKNQLGMMMGIGCGLSLGAQVLGYTLYNFGIVSGGMISYLPLLSYGAGGTAMTYYILGLVLSIHRYQSVISA